MHNSIYNGVFIFHLTFAYRNEAEHQGCMTRRRWIALAVVLVILVVLVIIVVVVFVVKSDDDGSKCFFVESLYFISYSIFSKLPDPAPETV